MRCDISWDIMRCHEISWYPMISHDIPWYIIYHYNHAAVLCCVCIAWFNAIEICWWVEHCWNMLVGLLKSWRHLKMTQPGWKFQKVEYWRMMWNNTEYLKFMINDVWSLMQDAKVGGLILDVAGRDCYSFFSTWPCSWRGILRDFWGDWGYPREFSQRMSPPSSRDQNMGGGFKQKGCPPCSPCD